MAEGSIDVKGMKSVDKYSLLMLIKGVDMRYCDDIVKWSFISWSS